MKLVGKAWKVLVFGLLMKSCRRYVCEELKCFAYVELTADLSPSQRQLAFIYDVVVARYVCI